MSSSLLVRTIVLLCVMAVTLYLAILPSSSATSISDVHRVSYYVLFFILSLSPIVLMTLPCKWIIKYNFLKLKSPIIIYLGILSFPLISSLFTLLFEPLGTNLSLDKFFDYLSLSLISLSGLLTGFFIANDSERVSELIALIVGVAIAVILVFFLVFGEGFHPLGRYFIFQQFLSLVFLFFVRYIKSRIIKYTLLVFAISLVFLSGTRTLLVFYLIFYIALLGARLRYFQILIVLIAIAFFLPFAGEIDLNHRLFSKVFHSERYDIWWHVISDLINEARLLIIGYGLKYDIYFLLSDSERLFLQTPHNSFILSFYYSGLIGLLLLVLFVKEFLKIVKAEKYNFFFFMVYFSFFAFFNDIYLIPHTISHFPNFWLAFMMYGIALSTVNYKSNITQNRSHF